MWGAKPIASQKPQLAAYQLQPQSKRQLALKHAHSIHTGSTQSRARTSFRFSSFRLRLVPAARARVMLSSRLQFACVVRNQFENVPRAVRLVPLRRSSAHPHSDKERDTHAALRVRSKPLNDSTKVINNKKKSSSKTPSSAKTQSKIPKVKLIIPIYNCPIISRLESPQSPVPVAICIDELCRQRGVHNKNESV